MSNAKKTIRFSSIKYTKEFYKANGSYYKYATDAYSNSRSAHEAMCAELIQKDWEFIPTKSGLTIFLQDEHIVRIWRFFD